jgi:hypothetical protein
VNWIDEIILEHNQKEADRLCDEPIVIDTPKKEEGMRRLLEDILGGDE